MQRITTYIGSMVLVLGGTLRLFLRGNSGSPMQDPDHDVLLALYYFTL